MLDVSSFLFQPFLLHGIIFGIECEDQPHFCTLAMFTFVLEMMVSSQSGNKHIQDFFRLFQLL